MATRKKTECCPLMAMVLSRARPQDMIGLVREKLYPLDGRGSVRDVVLVRFHKAVKGDKSKHAAASWAFINYCPFCGSKHNAEPKRKPPAARKKVRR